MKRKGPRRRSEKTEGWGKKRNVQPKGSLYNSSGRRESREVLIEGKNGSNGCVEF